jgi:regulator of sirC expression with transglutaminase-like and TPR domain
MGGPDVLEGAIRIARVEYPELSPARVRGRLDTLAREVRPAVEGRRGREAARALLGAFTGPLGFRGNHDDYGDPRNSYLNDVLERRTGIPITLCWVYVELARRLGLRAAGVGFPGHFLARAGQGNSALILDCFNGRELDRPACLELLASVAPGAPARLLGRFLEPAAPAEVLLRMVGNLRRVHEERGDLDRVLRWMDLLAEFGDRSPALVRDRGLVLLAVGRPAAALRSLADYLDRAPEAEDADAVRQRMSLARRALAELN